MSDTTLPARPGHDRLTANLLCVGSMFVWALGFPAVDALLPLMSPLALATARVTLGALGLIPVWIMLEGWAAVLRAPWGRGLAIGVLGFGLGPYLLVIAQKFTDGVTVAVTSASLPVVGIALECLLDGRRLTGRLALGLALSLVGGLVTYGTRLGELSFGLGAAAVLLSVLVFAWASRATVKSLSGQTALGGTTLTLAGGAAALLAAWAAVAAFQGPGVDATRFEPMHAGLLALYGFGALALSQVLFILAVGRLGVGIAAMHINAAPFYVMAIAVMTGGAWGWPQAVGAALVGAGVLVAQTPRRRA